MLNAPVDFDQSAQGDGFFPNFDTPKQRGTSPLEMWYSGVVNQTPYSTSGALATGTLFSYPFVLSRASMIDRIAFETTVVSGANGKMRAGIYAATSRKNIYPNALILDGGEFAVDAVAGIKSTTVSTFLPAGLYWFTTLIGTAIPTCRIYAIGAMSALMGVNNTIPTTPNSRLTVAQAYGALPSTYPAGGALGAGTIGPVVHVRFA